MYYNIQVKCNSFWTRARFTPARLQQTKSGGKSRQTCQILLPRPRKQGRSLARLASRRGGWTPLDAARSLARSLARRSSEGFRRQWTRPKVSAPLPIGVVGVPALRLFFLFPREMAVKRAGDGGKLVHRDAEVDLDVSCSCCYWDRGGGGPGCDGGGQVDECCIHNGGPAKRRDCSCWCCGCSEFDVAAARITGTKSRSCVVYLIER